jgi:hypothetical protein
MNGTTEASDVAHFATLWATVAVTLGRRVHMFAGDFIYPNVYLNYFGPTGDKKTTAQRRVFQCELLSPAATVRVIRNVGSTEGLVGALMKDSGPEGAYMLFWEELSSLLARGRWAGATIFEFITETFDCPPEWGLKYKNNPLDLPNPTPTILTATTAEWFWKYARSEDFFGGFGNRFLYLTGRKKVPLPQPEEPDSTRLSEIRSRLAKLARIPPSRAVLAPDAETLWGEFYLDWEGPERSGLVGAALKRIHVYVRKLAMTYAACEGTLPRIELGQLQAAIAVGLYASECVKSMIGMQLTNSRPEVELERRFLDWLRTHDGQKKRYMQQTMSKYCGSCEVFNRVLANLQKAGHVEVRDGNKVFLAQ